MQERIYSKQSIVGRLTTELINSGKKMYPDAGARFYGCSSVILQDNTYQTTVFLYDDITQAEVDEIDIVVNAHIPIPLPPPVSVVTPTDPDNKPYVRAEPRPLGCTTVFTCNGDFLGSGSIPPVIGGGDRVEWNAANAGEWVTVGDVKRKTIDLVFCDTVYLRGGHIFSPHSPRGANVSFQVMCPPNGYYMNLGQVKVNTTGDWLKVDENVVKAPLAHGEEPFLLDSFTASNGLPSGYRLRFVIEIPVAEVDCFGNILLLIYRERSVVV